MNNSVSCRSYHKFVDLLSDGEKNSLYTFEIIVLFFNLFFNTVVLCSIFKTQQFRIRYIRIIIYLCVSHILVGCITQPYMLYHFYYNNIEVHHCSKNIQTILAIGFFPFLSTYTIMVLIYDFHINVTHLDQYKEMFTGKKAALYIVYFATVAFMQSITLGIANALDITSMFAILPIDVIIFIIFACIYAKAILQYKQIEHDEEKMKFVNKEKLNLCFLYLVSIVVLKTPKFLIQIIELIMNKTSSGMAATVMLSFILSNCTCVVHAAMFIVVNKKTCQFCKKNLSKFRKYIWRSKNKITNNQNLNEQDLTISY